MSVPVAVATPGLGSAQSAGIGSTSSNVTPAPPLGPEPADGGLDEDVVIEVEDDEAEDDGDEASGDELEDEVDDELEGGETADAEADLPPPPPKPPSASEMRFLYRLTTNRVGSINSSSLPTWTGAPITSASGFEVVCSYNWLDTEKPTILVPGKS